MTTQQTTNPAAATRSGWFGWAVFAAVVLIMSGSFSAVQGLAALIGPNEYFLLTDDALWLVDLTAWGWWNLIIGALLILTAIALLGGQTWARVAAIVLAVLSAIGHLAQLPAQPWWSAIVIGVDVLIVYALTVHGSDLRRAD